MPSSEPNPSEIYEEELGLPLHSPRQALDSAPITEDESPRAGVVGATVGAPLDNHRFSLASQLLWLVAAATMVLLGAAIFAPLDHLEAVKSMASILFGPLVTLLGTSFAWYYATRKPD